MNIIAADNEMIIDLFIIIRTLAPLKLNAFVRVPIDLKKDDKMPRCGDYDNWYCLSRGKRIADRVTSK
jgi:hypothetical protein